MIKVHVVTWKTPLGPRISPYLNPVRTVRRVMYARFQAALNLAHVDASARVLDFGCWDGHFLPSLLENFEEVWGVDDDSASCVDALPSSSTILQIARTLCEAEVGSPRRFGLVKASGPRLPFPGRYFDVVFCLDTLAHVAPTLRPRVIAELSRITQPNGKLIFSLPIETGAVGALRQVMRALTRKQRDSNMRRYDFRRDLELLQSSFTICNRRFVPAQFLRALNPALIVECRRQLDQ